ncbi:hypothetical protein COCSUDRAFT_33840 [Coccomyxa subellipsoidea C-169]|uniref:Uncharacterized protein n=1 Tax=Coccomyxa subellipsoidea (strain C-169) TaxID=574566 RepID=I0YS84_COCSC|nr:hypothetical protein COCSUDRAFT_33840 [Coccomyxa subellipsoidea C-169]EIE21253.1 hypothetical protein COCSUDRAFT_33840 [Coccomyxa subellipsoidea C-169]|eukprot:XP_005645797.1 hypothetical protein COCSUDRAFT_33840 [Coccomyxa subellipsoidea C-169]
MEMSDRVDKLERILRFYSGRFFNLMVFHGTKVHRPWLQLRDKASQVDLDNLTSQPTCNCSGLSLVCTGLAWTEVFSFLTARRKILFQAVVQGRWLWCNSLAVLCDLTFNTAAACLIMRAR